MPVCHIPKITICHCYIYLWIHAIWPSVKWWVIPALQEELLLNLQSPTIFLLPIFLLSPYSTCQDRSAEYGWRRGHRKRDDKAKRGEGTIRSLTLLLSPQTRLRSCGTGINGIQLPGEMAAGSVWLWVFKLHVCSRWASKSKPSGISIRKCPHMLIQTRNGWTVMDKVCSL